LAQEDGWLLVAGRLEFAPPWLCGWALPAGIRFLLSQRHAKQYMLTGGRSKHDMVAENR